MKEELIHDAAGNAEPREQELRKPYSIPTLSPMEIFSEEKVLNCSKTGVKMAPNKVEVEEYAVGFDDGNGNDIGFDLTF